jgi:hypothetical protein
MAVRNTSDSGILFSTDLKDPQYSMYGKIHIPPLLAQQILTTLRENKDLDNQELPPIFLLETIDEIQGLLESLRGVAALALQDNTKVRVGQEIAPLAPEIPKITEQDEALVPEILKWLDAYNYAVLRYVPSLHAMIQGITSPKEDGNEHLFHTTRTAINTLFEVKHLLRETGKQADAAAQNLRYAQKVLDHMKLLAKGG